MKTLSFHYLSIALALPFVLGGCAEPPESRIVIAIDVSNREEVRLLQYSDLAFKCQRRFGRFTCVLYGNVADVVYDGAAIRDRSEFNAVIGKLIKKPRSEMLVEGTNHRSALNLAGMFAEGSQVPILVLTDGGSETSDDSLQAGIGTLSPTSTLYIFGVLPEHRETVLAATPATNARTVVRSFADADIDLVRSHSR